MDIESRYGKIAMEPFSKAHLPARGVIFSFYAPPLVIFFSKSYFLTFPEGLQLCSQNNVGFFFYSVWRLKIHS